MPRNIITTITVSDDDPPAVTASVHADGQQIAGNAPLSPQDAAKLIRTIGTATNDPDVEPALQQIVAPVVTRLQQAVQEGDATQAKRKDALTAWQAAAVDPSKPPNPNKP